MDKYNRRKIQSQVESAGEDDEHQLRIHEDLCTNIQAHPLPDRISSIVELLINTPLTSHQKSTHR